MNFRQEKSMSVARNAGGGLEVFARGTDDRLWHTWQTSDGWSEWDSLGGSIRFGPSVVNHTGGGLEVFSVGEDGALWHIWQESYGWSQWASLGGSLTDGPSAAVNHDGRVEVFARASNGQLWHISQLASYVDWSSWESLGGSVVGNPAVGRDSADGGLRVFVRGTDRTIYYSRQIDPSVSDQWDPFRPLMGPATTDAAIGISTDGRMEIFYADHEGAVRHVFQTAVGGSQWSSPGSFGGITGQRPAAARNSDGRLEIFHVGTDGGLFSAFQRTPNGTWSRWSGLPLGGLVSFPVAAKNADGRLEVFGISGAGNVINSWQERSAQGPWHSSSLGGATLGGSGRRIAELGRCTLWEAHYYD
jgi:hypothetical protein